MAIFKSDTQRRFAGVEDFLIERITQEFKKEREDLAKAKLRLALSKEAEGNEEFYRSAFCRRCKNDCLIKSQGKDTGRYFVLILRRRNMVKLALYSACIRVSQRRHPLAKLDFQCFRRLAYGINGTFPDNSSRDHKIKNSGTFPLLRIALILQEVVLLPQPMRHADGNRYFQLWRETTSNGDRYSRFRNGSRSLHCETTAFTRGYVMDAVTFSYVPERNRSNQRPISK